MDTDAVCRLCGKAVFHKARCRSTTPLTRLSSILARMQCAATFSRVLLLSPTGLVHAAFHGKLGECCLALPKLSNPTQGWLQPTR